jgi:hypothetical protein
MSGKQAVGEGTPSAIVPALSNDGGTSGDLPDFITSTSSSNWIRWQSMKSRALRLAFCLEMRRNVFTGPESASHSSPKGHLVNGEVVFVLASYFLHSSIHPSKIHLEVVPLQPIWCSEILSRRKMWYFFLSKTHR